MVSATTQSNVYVVDDDEGARCSLAFLLQAEGYPTRVFETASSFLQSAEDLPGGCVITDLTMPRIDGLELVRRIKARSLPITPILITGQDSTSLLTDALKAGAATVLEKPVRADALMAAVRCAFESHNTPPGGFHQPLRARMQDH